MGDKHHRTYLTRAIMPRGIRAAVDMQAFFLQTGHNNKTLNLAKAQWQLPRLLTITSMNQNNTWSPPTRITNSVARPLPPNHHNQDQNETWSPPTSNNTFVGGRCPPTSNKHKPLIRLRTMTTHIKQTQTTDSSKDDDHSHQTKNKHIHKTTITLPT